MKRAPHPSDSSSPWRLRALPIIALEPPRLPPRPLLALAEEDDLEEEVGVRRSQLPTLPGPLWTREETPTRPMFDAYYG